jgi:hypothetical protein
VFPRVDLMQGVGAPGLAGDPTAAADFVDTNRFAAAYIRPNYAVLNRDDVNLARVLPAQKTLPIEPGELDLHTLADARFLRRPQFWVAYLTSAFEAKDLFALDVLAVRAQAWDPNPFDVDDPRIASGVDGATAVAPVPLDLVTGSVVFLETTRESSLILAAEAIGAGRIKDPSGEQLLLLMRTRRAFVALHETCHQFFGGGHSPASNILFRDTDVAKGLDVFLEASRARFKPPEIAVLRERVVSPGSHAVFPWEDK